jgi:hypothetical protein
VSRLSQDPLVDFQDFRHIRVRGPEGVENGTVVDRRVVLEGGAKLDPLDHEVVAATAVTLMIS